MTTTLWSNRALLESCHSVSFSIATTASPINTRSMDTKPMKGSGRFSIDTLSVRSFIWVCLRRWATYVAKRTQESQNTDERVDLDQPRGWPDSVSTSNKTTIGKNDG